MKALRITFGFNLILFAVVLVGAALFGLVDPVGTRMADDGDPFGPPKAECSLCLY